MAMAIRVVLAAELANRTVSELGLDSSVLGLTSPEVLAAALRRAATLRCPCTPATLIRDVLSPMRGLLDLDELEVLIEDTLEAMTGYGDVVEQHDINPNVGHSTSFLYAAPPSFVSRKSGSLMLIGIAPDRLSALPEDLATRVEFLGHARRLSPVPGEDLRPRLTGLGLFEISYNYWLKGPRTETAAAFMAEMDQRLDSASPSRDIPGLVLLDPGRDVRFYRGRWVEPGMRSGRFIARRDQAYGAPLWCYVEVKDGAPMRMLDLPGDKSRWRGCDEAWHIQMAIDANRGKPQCFVARSAPGDTRTLELFSPVPMWAQRRWNAVGIPVKARGCLLSYQFARGEFDEEIRFASEALWLQEVPSDSVKA